MGRLIFLNGALALAQKADREKKEKAELAAKSIATLAQETADYIAKATLLQGVVTAAESEAATLDDSIEEMRIDAKSKANAARELDESKENKAKLMLISHDETKKLRDIGEKFKGVREAKLLAVTEAKRSLKAHEDAKLLKDGKEPAADVALVTEEKVAEPLSPAWLLPKVQAARIFCPLAGTFSQQYIT